MILKANQSFFKIRIYSYLYNQVVQLNPTDKLNLYWSSKLCGIKITFIIKSGEDDFNTEGMAWLQVCFSKSLKWSRTPGPFLSAKGWAGHDKDVCHHPFMRPITFSDFGGSGWIVQEILVWEWDLGDTWPLKSWDSLAENCKVWTGNICCLIWQVLTQPEKQQVPSTSYNRHCWLPTQSISLPALFRSKSTRIGSWWWEKYVQLKN